MAISSRIQALDDSDDEDGITVVIGSSMSRLRQSNGHNPSHDKRADIRNSKGKRPYHRIETDSQSSSSRPTKRKRSGSDVSNNSNIDRRPFSMSDYAPSKPSSANKRTSIKSSSVLNAAAQSDEEDYAMVPYSGSGPIIESVYHSRPSSTSSRRDKGKVPTKRQRDYSEESKEDPSSEEDDEDIPVIVSSSRAAPRMSSSVRRPSKQSSTIRTEQRPGNPRIVDLAMQEVSPLRKIKSSPSSQRKENGIHTASKKRLSTSPTGKSCALIDGFFS